MEAAEHQEMNAAIRELAEEDGKPIRPELIDLTEIPRRADGLARRAARALPEVFDVCAQLPCKSRSSAAPATATATCRSDTSSS